MRFDVLTIFPQMFDNVINTSILGRARENSLVEINLIDFREFSNNKHNKVDDYPYGGGEGMVIKPEPLYEAIESIGPLKKPEEKVVYMTAQGEPYNQKKAFNLSKLDRIVLICGHYEEIDERVRTGLVDEEISIGDYVLTGGELPAMVLMDSIIRLLPGVLGDENSAVNESFVDGLLEHPHYTRPEVFRDKKVPDVLLSGNHAAIRKWRRKESIRRTLRVRPELLKKIELSEEDKALLEELKKEEGL
ncbi:tRNA (guanosine(37)-N1)-methyltransferase TrmD [Natranaerofaba carboxydovora]|uniref:tRNA (guanosine(37)-N1)-methyltransferase TrmD n=1 Tax=Natranaerofaba carboxydovora TaxID=2742683 RepID=UPI001F1348EE|nr:tRNA (guanosine(37)-N1)-methyltransferase TrmD [Natranaerofaba carboxydovora]UMZ73337.1 tRNA (guanine-N(1)-)-methyltransferase [Natranaerofaba carboxydovora]